jgi:DNA modification methylase
VSVKIIKGDCRDGLRTLEAESVQTCVTSPPYWGLRDYGIPPSIWGGDPECGHDFEERRWYTEQSAAKTNGSVEAFSKPGAANAQRLKDARWRTDGVCKCGAWRGTFGLEPTYQLYVEHAVEVFREVRRVLRNDGILWLNLGDSYNSIGHKKSNSGYGTTGLTGGKAQVHHPLGRETGDRTLKHKDLVGIPWRVAFALQADGWWLRQDIIWSKPNPMPESVTDRCTKAHEYLFMLSKQERYYFDQDAILEPISAASVERLQQPTLSEQTGSERVPGKTNGPMKAVRRGKALTSPRKDGNTWNENNGRGFVTRRSGNKERKPAGMRDVPGASKTDPNDGVAGSIPWEGTMRNRRSVWVVTTQPFSEAHFATFPPALVEPCILAGCPEGGTVLDPFGGAGTTGLVADRLRRSAILIELNESYALMALDRIRRDAGMFSAVEIDRESERLPATPPLSDKSGKVSSNLSNHATANNEKA